MSLTSLLILLGFAICFGSHGIQGSFDKRNNVEYDDFVTGNTYSSSCGDKSQISDLGKGKGNSCSAITRRYVLYDINRGEGFNLKRDVFVRIAPIIKSLNATDSQSDWILVLPPWGQLPHWQTSKYFNWSTFFNVSEIKKYVPALEFEEYLEEYGLDNPVDDFYQLQHFPLNSPISKSWAENVRTGIECESPLRFKSSATKGFYHANFWKTALFALNASCLGVKGESSNIVQFILNRNPKSLMLDKAEVILWDHYGGPEWWRARKSLQFSSVLINVAENWIQRYFPDFDRSNLPSSNYLSVHLRRGDFVKYRKNQPSLSDVAIQIVASLSKLKLSHVFIASDGTKSDLNYLQKEASALSSSDITFLRLDCVKENLTDGECAVVDQILASWGKNFIGTTDSTFTLRIFEEREILGFQPDFNYHNFCTKALECPKATRWKING